MDYKNLSRNLLSKEAFWQVNKAIAKYTDNDTAILLADLISKEEYFENKGQMNGAYFFNTVENIKEDTNISKDRQRLCLKKLIDLGIIETKMLLIPRKRHYKINHEKLFLVLSEANKIYSERKTRRLESVNHDDCREQNTTTNNKNKYNENKFNENKNNIKGVFEKQNTHDIRYKSKEEFLKETEFNTGNNFYKISEMIYRNFLGQIGCNHYKLNSEQMDNFKNAVELINDVTEDWEQVRKIINGYFKLERAYYTIHDFTSSKTITYILGQYEFLGAERFNSDGEFEGVI